MAKQEPEDRRSLSNRSQRALSDARARVGGVLVAAVLLGGCSAGQMPEGGPSPAPPSIGGDGAEPDGGGAPGGGMSGPGGLCTDQVDCALGLGCFGGICLRTCAFDADCPGTQCILFPGVSSGYCDLGSGAAPAPPAVPTLPGAPVPPPEREPDQSPDAAPPAGPGDIVPPPLPEDDGPGGEQPPPLPGDDTPPPNDDTPPPADEPPEAPPCSYPPFNGGNVSFGRTLPAFDWADAVDQSGARVGFDLESFHCDPAYDQYGVVAFVVGAGWCSACEIYDDEMAGLAQAFRAAGGLLVFVVTEDANYSPADSQVAHRVTQRTAGSAPSLRVGDASTRPQAGGINNSGIVQSYPSAFVVRRSDMQVIAEQARENYTLDYVELARQNPPGGGPPPAPGGGGGGFGGGACGPDTEEAGEPNDDARQATPLHAGDSFDGGVCDGNPDFYRVEANGAWQLSVEFSHRDGDLDVYFWDEGRGDFRRGNDGQPIGSDSSDDDELVQGQGNAVLMVYGYEGARAPYHLSLR